MIIFLGNLPATATTQELCLMSKLPLDTHVGIFNKGGRNGETYRYALIYVDSESRGTNVITRLRGARCHGQVIEPRVYGRCESRNERRRMSSADAPWRAPERRKGERRLGA
jgi:hypothetical protein